MAIPILRLNIDDNPRIIVKQDTNPVVYTGVTATVLLPSGGTVVDNISGTTWVIYSPTGGTDTTILVGSGGTWCGNISGTTWVVYSPDWTADILGLTMSAQTAYECCTGNTADIAYISGVTDYHYQQFTGFTDYVYTLIVPAITGNTADISYLSGQTEIAQQCCTGLTATFNNYTGDTFITLSGITVAGALLQAQVNNLEAAFTGHTGQTGSGSIHFTGHTFTASGIAVVSQTGDTINYYVPADAITGVTWGSITGTLSGQTDLQAALDLKLDNSVYQGDMLIISGEIDDLTSGLTSHTGDTTIHYAQSAITITESQISDLQAYLTGVTWSIITGDVSGSTALQNALDLKLDNSVYQGDMLIISDEIDNLITGVTANTASIATKLAIDDFNTYTGTTAPNSFLPITGLTGYWTSAQTENYVTGLGYLTGVTSVGSGTTVLKTATEIKSLTATNLTLNAQTNEVNIEAGSIAPKDFWTGTEAQYLALGSYDSNTLYFCTA